MAKYFATFFSTLYFSGLKPTLMSKRIISVVLLTAFALFCVTQFREARVQRFINMKCAGVTLLHAYRDYTEHGNNPNYSNGLYWILLSNNAVNIGSTQYQYVITMHCDGLLGGGTLAMTTNRTFILFDSKLGPKIIDPISKPPNFW
jgi:hypothetical protein